MIADLYCDYAAYMHGKFPQFKVQKISINAGFSCPNRDGKVGWGGCTYCNNQTFNPSYCRAERSVTEQLEEGKRFFARKYPEMKYLAYFQAYTNTYDTEGRLQALYEEALRVPDVVGLVIGTRPDCVSEGLLSYLEELNRRVYVMVEYGIESTFDRTLERIHRGHNFACAEDTIRRTAERGIDTCGHIILGLPGETAEMQTEQARVLSRLPLTTIKLHQLQLIKGTAMAKEYAECPEDFRLFEVVDYIDCVIRFLEHLRPDMVVERFTSQSPSELLLLPKWGLKNHEFVDKLKREMRNRNTYQGRLYCE
jgi:radical SAM protein (TIGR01212 family)